MAHITLNDPIVGLPDATEEAKIPGDLDVIANTINGGLGGSNILPGFLDQIVQIVHSPGGNSLTSGHEWGVDFGTTSVSFSSSNVSTTSTVTHGLAAAPPLVLTSLFGQAASFSGYGPIVTLGQTSGSTQLLISAIAPSSITIAPNALFIYWLAISFVPTPTS